MKRIEHKEKELKKAKEYLKDRLVYSEKEIEKYVLENEEKIKFDLVEKFSILCEIVRIQQKLGIKDKIGYVHIAFLRTSLMTKSYTFQISAFNRDFWLDKEESTMELPMNFVFEKAEEDIKLLRKKNESNHFLNDFDYDELEYDQMGDYIDIAENIIRKLVPEAFKHSVLETFFNGMSKEEDIQVIFGGHMELGNVLELRD